MKTINLKDFYRTLYDHDAFCEVPDEVAELLILLKRREAARRRTMYNNKAHYSLDYGDEIEKQALFFAPSAESVFEQYMDRVELYAALQTLTEKQLKRLYAHFFLGMSHACIAKLENLDRSVISRSIGGALKKLSKKMNPR